MSYATVKQVAFITRLGDEKELDAESAARLDKVLQHSAELDMDRARLIIDWLLKQPDSSNGMTVTGLDVSDLEDGRYAIGDVLFLVQAPKDGKWAGWVFVKNGSEYTDERYGSQKPGRGYYGKHEDLLSVVLDDPLSAMQHYGRITDHCGVCGRKLEDDLSVERGIGPVCWEKIA